MYETFDLVLMVNHACNLRCAYCYTGAKVHRPMSVAVAKVAVDRAISSLRAAGCLDLGFFGGEPLLEADLILRVVRYAQYRAAEAEVELRVGLTTNGTLTTPSAWQVMTLRGLDVTISHDGLPDIHDRHRRGTDGRGSSDQVLDSIRQLLEEGLDVRISMVVRPDTASRFPDGIAWLREQGVRHVDPTLDLWADWSRRDAEELLAAIARAAKVWAEGLPDNSVSWFDEKAIKLTSVPTNATARCSYGDGQIAVAPSGNLYPCERVIGEDVPRSPVRLPGHVSDDGPFGGHPAAARSCDPCLDCALQQQCNTTCRCSNYIRTGDVRRPDSLLCLLDKACLRETARMLRAMHPAYEPVL